MRLTTVILIASLVQVSASTFAQRVSLQRKGITLEQVFKEIRNQTGYDILLSTNEVKVSSTIDANFKNETIEEVMNRIVSGRGLTYSIEDKTILLKKKEPSFLERLAERWAAIDVRGVVRNEKGEALEGITVVIKGANRGTTTNAKGEFFLSNVDERATLVFSGVTIETYEVKVKGKESMEVNVRTKQVQLEEVAVEYSTGYQKIPKERATGSFVFIDSTIINRRVDGNILARLKDLVPGLLFDKRRDGGGIGERLQLRGMYSFTEDLAVPLIVVDNFPFEGDINNINPNDVENITILRDAAAASIWGAKAGNGVIVITTKQGKYSQKAQVSLTSSIGLAGKPDLFKLPIVSTSEIVDLEQFLYEKGTYNFSLSDPMTPVSKVAMILDQQKKGMISQEESDRQLDILRNTDVRNDYLKYVYRNSVNQSHALNISGGTSVIKYFISAGYNNDLGSLKRNDNTRFTLSSNNTIQLSKKLEIQTSVNFSNSLVSNNNFLAYSSLTIPNYYNLADAEGNSLSLPRYFKQSFTDTIGGGKLLDWNYRPLEDDLKNQNNTNKSQRFSGRIGLNYDLITGLKINIDYQYSKATGLGRIYNSIESYYTRDLINYYTNLTPNIPLNKRYPVPMGGILDLRNTELSDHKLRSGFSFSQDWNNKHQINVTGGAEMSEKKTSYNASRNYGYTDELSTTTLVDNVNPYPVYLYSGFSERIPDLTNNKINNQNNRFTALYASGSYTYNSKYIISGSIRKDAANVLGVNTNQRGRPFWSSGILWKVNKENFYALGFLPSLNLRASFGNGGNTSFNTSANPLITYFPSSFNPIVNLPYAQISYVGNPDLRWEKVRTVNVGIDFGIKNDRISGSIEYYKKQSTDVLAYLPLDPTMGYGFILANSASIKGSGIDLSVNFKIIKSTSFNWNLLGGFSTAKFIVHEYLFEQNLNAFGISEGNLSPIKGYTPYLLTSYKWMGLDPANGDPKGVVNGQVSKDWNSITNSTPWDELVKHGSSVPVSYGNFLNNISYKGITLSANIIYKFNYYFRRPSFSYFQNQVQAGISGLSSEYNERWKVPGDEKHTNVPSFSYPFSVSRDIFYASSEARVERGDHIRIDDFSLSYGINSLNFKRLPFKNMSLTANVGNLNLILWKKTKTDLDPENPAGNIAGKRISVAVNLTF